MSRFGNFCHGQDQESLFFGYECNKEPNVLGRRGLIPFRVHTQRVPRSEDAEDPQRLNDDESGTSSFDHRMFYGTQGIWLFPLDTSRLAARSFISLAVDATILCDSDTGRQGIQVA
jgi:hypothetical protein